MRYILTCPLILFLAACMPDATGPSDPDGDNPDGDNLLEVSIDRTSHNFWNAPIRENEDVPITLTNKSGLTIKIESFSIEPASNTPPDHFQVMGSETCDVGTEVISEADADDGTCQLQIRFSPLHQGHYEALLKVNYLLEGDNTTHSIGPDVQGDGKLYCGH